MTKRQCKHSVLVESYSGARDSCYKDALPRSNYCLEHSSIHEIKAYITKKDEEIKRLQEIVQWYADFGSTTEKEYDRGKCAKNALRKGYICT